MAGWNYATTVDGFLAEDVTCDGVDNDCDGVVDEGGYECT